MEIQPGTIVRAKAGRENGRFFLVLCVEAETAYIADGSTRRIEKPKKKKLIHLAATRQSAQTQGLTNEELSRRLTVLNGETDREKA